LGKIRTIWGKLGQFGKYKDNLGKIRTIWGKLGQFGEIFRKIHHFIDLKKYMAKIS
jgi:hypothetical protein